jgi:hypothetical protein
MIQIKNNNLVLGLLGHELKDTIIVAYLLEYYSRHAKESAGWMCTVSKALPLLYKYRYGLFLIFNFQQYSIPYSLTFS